MRKTIRDLVVFAVQDVIKDPPFSHLDLLSCRNLLIYMDGDLQKRLMPLFHYALDDGGYLLLGSSETLAGARLAVRRRRQEVEALPAPGRRRAHAASRRHAAGPARDAAGRRARARDRRDTPLGTRALAERALLERHTPAGVVVNAEGNVLYFHGRTGRYLEPAAGETSARLVDMAREGLQRELAAGLRKALTTDDPVRFERLRVKTNGDFALVDLTVERVDVPDVAKGIFLVLFDEVPVPAEPPRPPAQPGEHEQRIADLERELNSKEEYLRTAVEELETSNEELKSTNEELQSTNEELQSTNEELETSKEELQSVNEELVTVNAELQQKIEELSQRQQRHEQPAGRHRHRHGVPGPRAAHPALHPGRDADHQPHPQRRRPADQRHRHASRRRPRPGRRDRGGPGHAGPARGRGAHQGGVPYLMRIQPYRTTENAA